MYKSKRILVSFALLASFSACQGCALSPDHDVNTATLFRSVRYGDQPDTNPHASADESTVQLASYETPTTDPVSIIVDETPRELSKVILPSYTIEPPDILFLQALQTVPKEPYHLQTGDVISVAVPDAFEDAPIEGPYPVGSGGLVQLGVRYGSVRVTGLTVEEAHAAIVDQLKKQLKPEFLTSVSVTLLQTIGSQQIEGQHLVGPDGTVTLGTYGSVAVVGMTIEQAKNAIESHLANFLHEPEVSLDVFSYNSKVFYVITQGAGLGDSVTRLPITGNETVLDAVALVSGLTEVSSKRIWISRPGRNSHGDYQILPVDWKGISELADVTTNYQIMPGDRILIAEDKWVAFDNSLAKFLAPFERAMGFSILGVDTVTRFSGNVLRGGGRGQLGGGLGL